MRDGQTFVDVTTRLTGSGTLWTPAPGSWTSLYLARRAARTLRGAMRIVPSVRFEPLKVLDEGDVVNIASARETGERRNTQIQALPTCNLVLLPRN